VQRLPPPVADQPAVIDQEEQCQHLAAKHEDERAHGGSVQADGRLTVCAHDPQAE